MVRRRFGRENMVAQDSSLMYLEALLIARVFPPEGGIRGRADWVKCACKLVLLGFNQYKKRQRDPEESGCSHKLCPGLDSSVSLPY